MQADEAARQYFGSMGAINGNKIRLCIYDTQESGKSSDAAAAIAAHGAFAAIGIIIYHAEVVAFGLLQQHKPIGTDAEAAVTQVGDLLFGKRYMPFAVVE